MTTPTTCRRCGRCCLQGGPALHRADLPLIGDGGIPLERLITIRRGELADNPVAGGVRATRVELVKIAGAAAAEGFLFLTPPLPKDLDTPAAKSFVAAFEKKFGSAPKSIYPVLAGDGFRVLAEAIKGANSVEPAKVSAFMKTALKDFPGLTGKISFNDKGDRIGEVYRVYQVNNQGDFVLQP
jgi:branched-chain amino acid transport system substrate-binding protein